MTCQQAGRTGERSGSYSFGARLQAFARALPLLLLVVVPGQQAGALIPDRSFASEARFTGPAPARGRLLIAARRLRDPRFAHSVILLVEYGEQGAVGVIINFPTRITLGEALPDFDRSAGRGDRIYRGGPVGRDHLLLLVRAPQAPENSSRVIADLYLSASLDTLRQVIGAGRAFHAYAGYAGWAPGQLESEVARGDWHVTEGGPELVFEAQPEKLWSRLIRGNTGEWVRYRAPRAGGAASLASDRRR